MAENEAIRRLQASIDMLKERMRIDSNDLEYESHLRQKRQLQRILDRLLAKEADEKKYGVPQIKLDIHATRSELLKLREKLMAIRDLSAGKEQGYLDIDCKLYIDVDDIDRYLSGELDTIGEIYAFPEDIKSYREE